MAEKITITISLTQELWDNVLHALETERSEVNVQAIQTGQKTPGKVWKLTATINQIKAALWPYFH